MSTNCEQFEIMLSGLVDRELPEKERSELFAHLSICTSCQKKYDELLGIKEETMRLKDSLSLDMSGDQYWSRLYNKLERSLSWFLTIIGGGILIIFGLVSGIVHFWSDPSVPLIVKIGAVSLLIGVGMLLFSVVREKLFVRKYDKYREIQL